MNLQGKILVRERMKVAKNTLFFPLVFRGKFANAKQILNSWVQRINFGINNYEKHTC
jgi:hypothetical protein